MPAPSLLQFYILGFDPPSRGAAVFGFNFELILSCEKLGISLLSAVSFTAIVVERACTASHVLSSAAVNNDERSCDKINEFNLHGTLNFVAF